MKSGGVRIGTRVRYVLIGWRDGVDELVFERGALAEAGGRSLAAGEGETAIGQEDGTSYANAGASFGDFASFCAGTDGISL